MNIDAPGMLCDVCLERARRRIDEMCGGQREVSVAFCTHRQVFARIAFDARGKLRWQCLSPISYDEVGDVLLRMARDA